MGKLCLVWYYHAPAVMTDSELIDVVRESLAPLLDLHERMACRVAVALTGTLLSRLAHLAPREIESIGRLKDLGLLEIVGTFGHEVFPPLLPNRRIERQVEAACTAYQDILGVRPLTFFPANFVWLSTLPRVLERFGYRVVLLDEAHFVYATGTQTWRWQAQGYESHVSARLLRARASIAEIATPYSLAQAGTGEFPLTCLFRSSRYHRLLSFGNEGLLHRPFDESTLDEVILELHHTLRSEETIVLADDGDRINPTSLYSYERLLERIRPELLAHPDDYVASPHRRSLAYLPSFSPSALDRFLTEDLDARHYIGLLGNAYEVTKNDRDPSVLLELEDVFFLFWKTHPRKSWYLQKVLELIDSAGKHQLP